MVEGAFIVTAFIHEVEVRRHIKELKPFSLTILGIILSTFN